MTDFITVSGAALVVSSSIIVGAMAVARAIKALPRSGRSASASGMYRFLLRPSKELVPALAVGGFFAALWMSSEWWWATKRAEATHTTEQVSITARAEVQAAYEAAAQPNINTGDVQVETLPSHAPSRQGYVYLGQCDKQWVPGTARFTRMPPCTAALPEDGFILISRQGDVIRSAPPATENGARRFGEEVARVSAGYSVKLRKMFAVSIFASGPQYYWGLVDFPTDRPRKR